MSGITDVLIFCDAESHARNKVSKVGRLRLGEMRDGTAVVRVLLPGLDTEYLADDEKVTDGRERLGRQIGGPPRGAFDRARYRLECRLCGLNVEMRHETALKLATGYAAAGVKRLRLSALAANL